MAHSLSIRSNHTSASDDSKYLTLGPSQSPAMDVKARRRLSMHDGLRKALQISFNNPKVKEWPRWTSRANKAWNMFSESDLIRFGA